MLDVDWQQGADHMLQHHAVSVIEAKEAIASRGQVLVIVLVAREDKPDAWWGAKGWVATGTDRIRYRRENDHE